ncbi:MAG: antitoxin [Acidobacteriota bacterium]
MRTTVTLDNDVYQAAVHLSRTTGKRLGKVISELARRGMTQSVPASQRGRFPVFHVPADAPIIAASRVQEIIDEEGIF